MRAAAMLLLAAALPAAAQDLALPFPATETLSTSQPLASHRIATGPARDGAVPFETVEGAVARRAVEMRVPEGTGSLAVLAPVRDALVAEGWEPRFACETRGCGGWDFRFWLDVAEAPAMFVNLADFRYLALARGPERLALLVSPSGARAYLQAVHVAPEGTEPALAVAAAPTPPGAVGAALAATGRAVLGDLVFATGSAALPEAEYASLDALAAYLREVPDARVALVGHTDAEGGAAGNIAISRARAEAARRRLVALGVAPSRVETHGVGYFAPLARNDTARGREANRRVEAVLVSVPE
ncbi:OmpA family protein [Jannaschia sp. W003]|uniref:OmpA family protein n=1 Tax=Jannaschia sp. W003 TaxID=2867012 RepID=UPI0021A47FE1|nr:OmpA family protein [Jannaschia sp. W003]UWQ21884.1 OmpA family protein [Jannaschia sp. W003]